MARTWVWCVVRSRSARLNASTAGLADLCAEDAENTRPLLSLTLHFPPSLRYPFHTNFPPPLSIPVSCLLFASPPSFSLPPFLSFTPLP